MKTNRIQTTHTGSLPRPDAVLRLLADMDAGHAVDAAASEALLERSVCECVDRQIAAGIDVVNDGEVGKPGYSTYVKDRLTGFGGGILCRRPPTSPTFRTTRSGSWATMASRH